MVTASLKNYRQSPRKVRIVADLIRGKRVSEALSLLTFTTKKATDPLAKLVLSAVANAKNLNIATENLFVKEIRVDAGIVLKRQMPRARGSSSPIHKRSSHVHLVLDEKIVVDKKAKKIAAPVVKEAAKVTKAKKVAKTPKA
ncbi:MAG: 50S ribosomal protein L22 [Candidatus Paceibacterota bacterium]|jgi:large subunit ribosomal protein L22